MARVVHDLILRRSPPNFRVGQHRAVQHSAIRAGSYLPLELQFEVIKLFARNQIDLSSGNARQLAVVDFPRAFQRSAVPPRPFTQGFAVEESDPTRSSRRLGRVGSRNHTKLDVFKLHNSVTAGLKSDEPGSGSLGKCVLNVTERDAIE